MAGRTLLLISLGLPTTPTMELRVVLETGGPETVMVLKEGIPINECDELLLEVVGVEQGEEIVMSPLGVEGTTIEDGLEAEVIPPNTPMADPNSGRNGCVTTKNLKIDVETQIMVTGAKVGVRGEKVEEEKRKINGNMTSSRKPRPSGSETICTKGRKHLTLTLSVHTGAKLGASAVRRGIGMES